MAETAAHRVDHVFPQVLVRQWVLALPKRLRLSARSPGAAEAAHSGAVTFVHCFGSTLNANLYFHCRVMDGVFEAAPAPFGAQGEGAHFHERCDEDVAAVQRKVRIRVLYALITPEVEPRYGDGSMGVDSPSMPRFASKPRIERDWSARCGIAPDRSSPAKARAREGPAGRAEDATVRLGIESCASVPWQATPPGPGAPGLALGQADPAFPHSPRTWLMSAVRSATSRLRIRCSICVSSGLRC